jgi:AcrR family transcriptional regulator
MSVLTERYQRTHMALQRAALQLMTQRGFDGVTVAEIAAAARVTEMTAFRHFAVKEDLIVEDLYDSDIGEAIRAQPGDLRSLVRAARGLAAAWAALDEPAVDETRDRLRLVACSPRLRARAAIASESSERVIAEALAEGGVRPLVARIAAAACIAALTAALYDWASDPTAGALGWWVSHALSVLEGAA